MSGSNAAALLTASIRPTFSTTDHQILPKSRTEYLHIFDWSSTIELSGHFPAQKVVGDNCSVQQVPIFP